MNRALYNEIIKEHFDITDRNTRKVLVSIDESDQNQVLGNLATKLYNSIVKKVTDIDFGQIPLSKGDITKIPNYMDIVECLTTIRDMMQEKRQTTTSVDTIFTAIENLKKYKNIWERGYLLDCEIAIVFYNTIALSIVSATSLLISATVEFIKNPDSEVIDLELAKVANTKTKDGLLFKNLDKFNKSCKKGDIEKTFNNILKAQREVREASEDMSGISERMNILPVNLIIPKAYAVIETALSENNAEFTMCSTIDMMRNANNNNKSFAVAEENCFSGDENINDIADSANKELNRYGWNLNPEIKHGAIYLEAMTEANETYVTENIATIIFTGTMVVSLLTCVIPILHQLTSILFNLRQSVAEYLAGEADIIRLNAEKVQYNRTKTPEQKKKIIARQNRIADHFKKWSNALMIKSTKAEKESEKQIKKDQDNKNKIEDVVDEIPGTASIF